MAKKKSRFKISNTEFSKFLGLVDELNKISDEHKFVWDDKGIFVYSIEGEKDKINLLKTFYISRDRLFSNMPADLILNYSMYNTKNFVKKFGFIGVSDDTEYKIAFDYDDDSENVHLFEAKNTTLEMRAVASENTIKHLTLDVKKGLMDKSMANCKFNLSIEDLEKIKKISKLDSESETIDLKIENGIASFSEAQWELKVAEDIDSNDIISTFKKDYLNAIVPAKDEVEFCIFETYILIDEHKSQILFTLELIN